MTAKNAALVGFLGLTSLACDARTAIGTVPDGGGPGDNDGAAALDASSDGFGPDLPHGNSGGTCTPVTFPGDAAYTLPAGIAGTWTGYFQGGSPLQTSDVVKFSIQQLASGNGEIHVTMGTAAPPPPATSATDYYPTEGTSNPTLRLPQIIEGVSYLAHAVSWQGTRLKLQLSVTQPWESWCALQASYFVSDQNRYNCVPGFGGVSSFPADAGATCISEDEQGQKQTPVSCAQFSQCNGQFCACDSCGCSAAAGNSESFDVTFDGDVVTGVGAAHNVRLTRDPS